MNCSPLVTELHHVLHDGAADEREYKRLVESVKASTFTAFYTPPAIVNAIASSLGEHGVSPGRFLDPSSGTGNLFSLPTAIPLRSRQRPPKLSPMKRICLPAASSPGSDPASHRSISRASRELSPASQRLFRRGEQQHTPSATYVFSTRPSTTARPGVLR